MFWRKKESNWNKTPLQLLEEELIRLHNDTKVSGDYEKGKRIDAIITHLISISSKLVTDLIPSRIKSLEENVADLYLTGRDKEPK